MSEWLPMETIPRDGSKVELLSPSEGVDIGHWYDFAPDPSPPFPEWTPEVGDDWSGGISTNNGSGDYTHWRPLS